MKRLFFNLYIVITLGLLTINWTGELLWQKLQDDQSTIKNKEISAISQLVIDHIRLVSTLPTPQRLVKLNSSNTAQYSIHSVNDFAFLPTHIEQLKLKKAVHLYNEIGQLVIYASIEFPLVYQVKINGEYATNQDSDHTVNLILTIFSYLLLAGLIFIWTRPLWTDINKLTDLTKQFSTDSTALENPLTRRSVLFSLGHTMSVMSHKIMQLIALQKQMTHAISHDIRTPLARLKFSLAIVNSDKNNIETRNQVTRDMRQDIEEIERLIDEMLTYGRLDTLESPLVIESVDIYQLMTNLIDKLQRQSEIPITLNISDQTVFYCDGHLLERAVQNIIVNGLRYAKTEVQVTVEANAQLAIQIDDDGPGIDVAQRAFIFKPFTRLEDSRSKQLGGGFGLGLSIADKIIHWHRGQLQVTHNPSGGARFTISLPKPSN